MLLTSSLPERNHDGIYDAFSVHHRQRRNLVLKKMDVDSIAAALKRIYASVIHAKQVSELVCFELC